MPPPRVPYVLLPGIIDRIAQFLDENEVACSFRRIDKATALQLKHCVRVRLSQPVPTHAFVEHWTRRGALRSFSTSSRRRFVTLTAASGSLPNLQIAILASGLDITSPALTSPAPLESAASQGHLHICEWLRQQGCTLESALESTAGAGRLESCVWLLAHDCGWELRAVFAALRGGHMELADWLWQQRPEEEKHPASELLVWQVGTLLTAAAEGCDTRTFQQLHQRWMPVRRHAVVRPQLPYPQLLQPQPLQLPPPPPLQQQQVGALQEDEQVLQPPQQQQPTDLQVAERQEAGLPEWPEDGPPARLEPQEPEVGHAPVIHPGFQAARLGIIGEGPVDALLQQIYDDQLVEIVAAAAGSRTSDWKTKLEWLEEQGYPRARGACEAAAVCPDAVERLRWLIARGYKANVNTLSAAAVAGNLEAVEILLERLVGCCQRFRNAMMAAVAEQAAGRGHVGLMRVLRAHGWQVCLQKVVGSMSVLEGEHVAVLDWAEEVAGTRLEHVGVEEQHAYMHGASRSGNVRMLEWLHERGCRADENIFRTAAKDASEEVLEWLLAHGYCFPKDGAPYVSAARAGDLTTLNWLRQMGCPWGPGVRTLKEWECSAGVRAWLDEMGLPYKVEPDDEYADESEDEIMDGKENCYGDNRSNESNNCEEVNVCEGNG